MRRLFLTLLVSCTAFLATSANRAPSACATKAAASQIWIQALFLIYTVVRYRLRALNQPKFKAEFSVAHAFGALFADVARTFQTAVQCRVWLAPLSACAWRSCSWRCTVTSVRTLTWQREVLIDSTFRMMFSSSVITNKASLWQKFRVQAL